MTRPSLLAIHLPSEEGIHILIRVFVEFSVNGKRTAIHAILVTFQKESNLLFL